MYNRKSAPKGCKNTAVKNIYVPHRFAPLDDIRVRAVASGCNAAHSIIITEDYKVYTLGKLSRSSVVGLTFIFKISTFYEKIYPY